MLYSRINWLPLKTKKPGILSILLTTSSFCMMSWLGQHSQKEWLRGQKPYYNMFLREVIYNF